MGLTGVERSKKIVELLELPINWEEYYELALKQHKILMHNVHLMPGMLMTFFNSFQIQKMYIRAYLRQWLVNLVRGIRRICR